MLQGDQDYLKLGDWNALCDVCGFKFKASQLRRRWDGYMVCTADYEERHPQDLIKLRPDRQAVPWARPYPQTDTREVPYIAPVPTDIAPDQKGTFVVVAPVDPDSL